MASITTIPSTRVSDLLVRTRLMAQLQLDQRDMFYTQNQIVTGRRIFVPSDDAPSALRAISLQRLIERKTQLQTNLATNQSYLSATDSTLSSVSSIISDVRGAVLGVADTLSTDVQRKAVAQEVDRALQQLISTGNQQFRGRYLFAGSRTTVKPFELLGQYIQYSGNESELQSYSDLDVLFESSVHGNEIFGAISEPLRGQVDLNPVTNVNTRLDDLHAGAGVRLGSITVSDGTSSVNVDLSSAKTLGDVARLLETHAPGARSLIATIGANGLSLTFDDGAGGNLRITEVANGSTARELGILRESSSGGITLEGADLNPVLRPTTRLADLLGSRAYARVASTDPNNDLSIESVTNGAAHNNVAIQFVDDDLLHASAGLSAGNEVAEYSTTATASRGSFSFSGSNNDLTLTAATPGVDFNNVTFRIATQVGNAGLTNGAGASYNASTKVLTVTLDSTNTAISTADIRAAIDAEGTFTTSLDASVDASNNGTGTVNGATAFSGQVGSTGNSGGAANTLFIRIQAGATTANQAAAAITSEGTFRASAERRDSQSLAQVGEGLVDVDATATTQGGSGADFDKNSGLSITNAGQTYQISFGAAETVEDLINILNGSGAGLAAQISADRTGIDVRSRLSGADFSIGENGGSTASQLGIRSFTTGTLLADLNFGLGIAAANGTDFTITRNDGVELDIDVSGAVTIGDVLDLINNSADNTSPGKIVARLAQNGNGIELVDDDPSGSGTITVTRAETSEAAILLGLIPPGSTSQTATRAATAASATLNLSGSNTDLAISAGASGTGLNGVTVQFINSAASGDQALVSYNASSKILTIDVDPLATTANTVAAAITTDGTFTAALSTAAGANDGSGLVVDVGTIATTAGGTAQQLTGRDVNLRQTDGVFNSLLRLKAALEQNDTQGIAAAMTQIDSDLGRINFGRAEVGARQQALETLQDRIVSEDIDLQAALSKEVDVDATKAISEFTARQVAFQAALQTAGAVLRVTLLDYL